MYLLFAAITRLPGHCGKNRRRLLLLLLFAW
jgi:hypothetical protein